MIGKTINHYDKFKNLGDEIIEEVYKVHINSDSLGRSSHDKLIKVISKAIYFKMYLFILVSLLLGTDLYAQIHNIQFDQFSIEDGISYGRVNCIIQDDQGFLWFGTSYGLNRYDGREFINYLNSPTDSNSISDNKINCLYVDRSGILWVGTRNGLNKYDKYLDRFIRYMHDPDDTNSLSSKDIEAFYEDKAGNCWIAGENGLTKANHAFTKYKHFKHIPDDPNSLPKGEFGSMYLDSFDKLWIVTHGYENEILSRLDVANEDFTYFTHNPNDPNSLAKGFINQVYEDKSRNLWIGTGGLNRFNRQNNTFTQFNQISSETNDLSSNDIKAICEGKSGRFWIGTLKALYIFDRKKNTFSCVTKDEINASLIYEDQSGVLWIGGGRVLSKYDREREQFPAPIFHGFNAQTIEDQQGITWIATDQGLHRIDRKSGKHSHFNINPTGDDNYLSSLLEDSRGKLWVGTSHGIYHFDRSQNIFKKINLELTESNLALDTKTDLGKEKFIYVMEEDSTGFIWIGTKEGLYQYNEAAGTLKLYQHDKNDSNSLQNNSIRSIYIDKGGEVWICATALHKYDSKNDNFTRELVSLLDPEGPGRNRVHCILESDFGSNGSYWIGTEMGLFKYDRTDKTSTHFIRKDWLSRIVVREILEDSYNNLWILTANGLSVMHPSTNIFKNYSADDGLLPGINWELMQNRKGEIFFGGPKGLAVFHPDNINDDLDVPAIVLTGFKIFNEEVDLDSSITLLNQLNLNYDENMISFEFAALNFTNPGKHQFAHKMEGFNKNWIYIDNNNEATYTNLLPGKYTFRVKGSNHDDIWNEEGVSLRIVIHPPWWLTWWAYLIYAIIFIGVLSYLYFLQRKRLGVIHRLEMKEFETEKLKEVNQMKSQFFANISHEFRTPLTLIKGPVERLLDKEKADDKKKIYRVIKRNSERLLNLINELLDLSKLESGKMKLSAKNSDIVSFVKALVMSFESLVARKEIKLSVTSSSELIELYFDKEKMQKIITNLLSNALKFTNKGGEVSVNIEEVITDRNVYIKITDTGIGIPEEELPKIFDRFYQADNFSSEGTGIGLSLTKELVEIHHGTVEVESVVEKGTTFTLTFPLGKGHLNDEELIYDKSEQFIKEDLDDETIDSTIKEEEGKALILVVEDNKDVRDFIAGIFNDDYNLLEAENGEEGYQMSLDQMPDLIVSDIMMPKLTGDKMCEMLKNNQITSHIPVILLTAKSSGEDKIEGLEIGADDYLIKPFNEKELLARINNLLVQRKNLREKYLREAEIHPTEVAVTSQDKRFVEKVIRVLEKNISLTEFNVEKMAYELAVSRVQLYRKFISLFGEKPNEFIRNYRIRYAAQLIKENFGNITEVAYEVGFSDPSHFAKCFKNVYKVNPHEYEKNITHRK